MMCVGVCVCPCLPLGVVPGFGQCWCFRQMNRVLERPLQMSHPLLDHLPDVFNPLLFSFHIGRLEERTTEELLFM